MTQSDGPLKNIFDIQTIHRSGHGGTSLTYDDAGNLTADENGDTLVYDAWNRVVAIKSGTLTLESYAYDGAGRRIGQI